MSPASCSPEGEDQLANTSTFSGAGFSWPLPDMATMHCYPYFPARLGDVLGLGRNSGQLSGLHVRLGIKSAFAC